jgi:hypothetical protein
MPPLYLCLRADRAPEIDGRLDDPAWRTAPWTAEFVDIEGSVRPAPTWRTRAKLMWDDQFLYVGAELEEPHVWATLEERDAVIYQDNDFEIFIDPDGDTHQYYELEINALGTVWDLFLVKPYRDGGPALHGWDIPGLRTAVAVDGTLNDPSDRDAGWTVEMALPWSALAVAAPGRRPPTRGERWRVNFSRVQWDVDVVGSRYVKRTDPATGKPLSEHNWVWAPQGAVDMHRPEMWGIVQFGERSDSTTNLTHDPDESTRMRLRQVYYAEREFFRAHRRYTDDAAVLRPADGGAVQFPPGLSIGVTPTQFEATAPGSDGRTVWHIRQDGKIWSTR